MRGGTRKGLFLHAGDLPASPRARDALLLRIVGSPDPHRTQVDGLGGATPATSWVVVVSRSTRPDCDLEYLAGAVSLDAPVIDWSGNCDSLSAAVGPYAIATGLVRPGDGIVRVRLWQASLGERIDAFVPVRAGEVVEAGGFVEDGVPFPSAEIRLEFLRPAGELFPTGLPRETLAVPGHGEVEVTLVTTGRPTVFVRADALGLAGRELPDEVERNRRLLERLASIRVQAAVRMGLATRAGDALRPCTATPTVCWVARPAPYRTRAGVDVAAEAIDLLARTVTTDALQPADDGTGSVALAVAAAVPGTVVGEVARTLPGVATRIGLASGMLAVGAEVSHTVGADGRVRWIVEKCVLSRGARRLMSGWVHLPAGP